MVSSAHLGSMRGVETSWKISVRLIMFPDNAVRQHNIQHMWKAGGETGRKDMNWVGFWTMSHLVQPHCSPQWSMWAHWPSGPSSPHLDRRPSRSLDGCLLRLSPNHQQSLGLETLKHLCQSREQTFLFDLRWTGASEPLSVICTLFLTFFISFFASCLH